MSKLSRLTEHYKNALDRITTELKARASYRVDPTFGFLPSSFDVDKRSWGSVSDAYHETTLSVPNMINLFQFREASDDARIKHIQDSLEANTPYKDFSFLAQGSGTIVMLGRAESGIAVLRVVAHPDSMVGKNLRDDCVRSNFPGLLHGISQPVDIEGKLRVETLPFVQSEVIPAEDRILFDSVLLELTQGTCYTPKISEFAILPDFTLMGLDPGECPYAPEFWDLSPEQRVAEEKRSIDIIIDRMHESSEVLASLGWITADGKLKQDVFFPATGGSSSLSDDATLQI